MREKKDRLLRLESIDHRELYLGIAFLVVSLMMPLLFHVRNFGVRDAMLGALRKTEKADLIAAAIRLVALNSLRGLPHYVGAYFIGESLAFGWGKRRAWPLSAAIIPVVLLVVYHSIERIHGIRYDFGVPAILACFFVLLLRTMNYRYLSLWKKGWMISLVLVAVQFLDVMPMVEWLPVGRGDISREIRMAAVVLDGEAVLNTTGAAGMALFCSFALLTFSLLREENSLKELNCLKEENQAILVQSKLSEMKNRTYQELQYLVHDLKSPLTTVQTLVGVVKMKAEAEQREQDVEYLDHVEHAVERMSEMISELLHYDKSNVYTTRELLDAALAQCSVKQYCHWLRPDNRIPDVRVSANRLLFARALINLMENSAQAMGGQPAPEIRVLVDRDGSGNVYFSVEDNGEGIPENEVGQVWNHGISGHNSSGMGLAFVRTALERMNGGVSMYSTPGEGTAIRLILPEEREENK